MTERFEISASRDVEQRLQDGTVLRSDVYAPDADGPFPVLICRTPYNKLAARNVLFAEAIASRGYVSVVQDVRGAHASDGDFVWHNSGTALDIEARDGYECVEWAARLAKSDGRVGTFGVSYAAWLSWCLMKSCPPSLKALSASGMTSSIRDMNFGIVETGRRLQWTYSMGASLRNRAGDHRWPSSIEEGDADWIGRLRSKWIWHLPLAGIPDRVFGPLAKDLRTYYGEQALEHWPFERYHANITYPVCVQTGWWDRFSLSCSHYVAARANGPPDLADKHRLVIGPWPHFAVNFRRKIGPVDYGPDADAEYPDIVTDWYDFHFKERETEIACGAPVQLFILNDTWRGYDNWPPPGMKETSFFLSSGGKANTPSGDGELVSEPPGDQEPDRYVYDPADPVMSLMGPDAQFLPVDQAPNAHREDILVYRSAPLEQDMVFAGPLRVELWASSNRLDTDFSAKLIEVRPDGTAVNISTGILRARYRNGYDQEVRLEPGEPALFSVTMLPVGIRFLAGSRVRIDITSSDFPAFDRNHNTGGDDWNESTLLVAKQTVFHDSARPSRIVMPLLPG